MAGNPVDRFVKPTAPASRVEPKDLGFTADAGGSARMIDFVFKNGDRTGLPYSYMVSVRLIGGETIELEFTEKLVQVRGRNLGPLYQHLLAQSARRVEESGSGFDDDRLQSWVESIVIEPRS